MNAAAPATSAGQTIFSLVFLAIAVAAYFLPTITAALRHLPNVAQIALLNFFLGWTMIGWIIALIWAAKPQPAR